MRKLLVLTLTASLLTLQGTGCFVNGEAFAQAQKAYVSAYNKEGVCTVKLAKYKGLNAAIDTAENYEKRANEFIGYLKTDLVMYDEVSRPVQPGDTVTIDITKAGKQSGTYLDDFGSFSYTVGENEDVLFYKTLSEGIIGMQKGQEKVMTVKDTMYSNIRNAETVIEDRVKVKVNAVQLAYKGEMDENWFQKAKGEYDKAYYLIFFADVNNLEEFKERVKTITKTTDKLSAGGQIVEQVAENSEVVFNEDYLNSEIDKVMKDYEEYCKSTNINLEDYLASEGYSGIEQKRQALREVIIAEKKLEYVKEAIMAAENMNALSDQDYSDIYEFFFNIKNKDKTGVIDVFKNIYDEEYAASGYDEKVIDDALKELKLDMMLYKNANIEIKELDFNY